MGKKLQSEDVSRALKIGLPFALQLLREGRIKAQKVVINGRVRWITTPAAVAEYDKERRIRTLRSDAA